jgi:glycosyltransferase involved in cell wall biosynthesis
MKILQLISVHQWTGPADYVIKLTKFLSENGCETLLGFRSFYEGALKELLVNENINFTEELKFPRGFKPYFIYKDYKSLKKLVESFKPDIIHCHNSIENILSSMLKKKSDASNFKLVRSIHNLKSTQKRFLSRYLLNINDYILTNCNDFKEKLIADQNIDSRKIKIIHGFVDFPRFNLMAKNDFLSVNYGVDKDDIRIGMVARFQPYRGHINLIKAYLKLISDGHKNVKLILVGRGEILESLRKYVKVKNLNQNIIFTGYIKNELPMLLNSLDIFVLLQEGSDGSCRAVLEAMAAGLPIVTVYKGALKDTIVDNYNGLFIDDKENVNVLYSKLKQLVKNKNLRITMKERSRELAEKKFSMEKQLKKYYEFYKEIVKE